MRTPLVFGEGAEGAAAGEGAVVGSLEPARRAVALRFKIYDNQLAGLQQHEYGRRTVFGGGGASRSGGGGFSISMISSS